MSVVVRPVTVTIANNTAVSDGFAVQLNERVVGVETPAAWTAADIGVDVSQDNATYFQVTDAQQTAALTFYRIARNVQVSAYNTQPEHDIAAPFGTAFVRIHSLNAANANDVNQGGARTCVVFIAKEN